MLDGDTRFFSKNLIQSLVECNIGERVKNDFKSHINV